MNAPELLAAPLAAAVVGFALWVNRRVYGFLPEDRPRPGRKQHRRPMPMGGAALLPVLAFWLAQGGLWWLLAGVVAVAGLGFVDDWRKERGRDLGWRTKAAVLVLAAALCATQAHAPWATDFAWTDWALCVLVAFVLTNATNFLDNTDGVSMSLSGTSLLLATGGAGPLAACGYAALGFLPWNWPQPRLFPGDAGALCLGLCSGFACGTALTAAPLVPFGALHAHALLPFAVQLADFTQVIVARLCIGVSPFVGDRRHLTHIAQNLGLPAVLVAPLFAAVACGVWALGRQLLTPAG